MAIDRIYMDSCCFIESVKDNIGTAEKARENDLWHLKKLLEASLNGDVQVITSMLTLAECRHARDPKNSQPTDEVKRLFRSVLVSGRIVTLAQVTLEISEYARDLHWDHGINLGGADAIHVATAIKTGCKEFLSFDYGKSKSPVKLAPQLKTFGLIAEEPANTALLPTSYRQIKIPGHPKP